MKYSAPTSLFYRSFPVKISWCSKKTMLDVGGKVSGNKWSVTSRWSLYHHYQNFFLAAQPQLCSKKKKGKHKLKIQNCQRSLHFKHGEGMNLKFCEFRVWRELELRKRLIESVRWGLNSLCSFPFCQEDPLNKERRWNFSWQKTNRI